MMKYYECELKENFRTEYLTIRKKQVQLHFFKYCFKYVGIKHFTNITNILNVTYSRQHHCSNEGLTSILVVLTLGPFSDLLITSK